MKTHENNKEYDMTDTEALLSPARIRGFAFIEKLWAFFLIENIAEIGWSESAFEELELEHTTNKTLQSLFRDHYQGKPGRICCLAREKG